MISRRENALAQAPMFAADGAMYNGQCIATDDPRLKGNKMALKVSIIG
jgi:hypothetical protein